MAIGELANRTGLSVSAIRFYEERGLIEAFRNAGGHRRFLRADIRRLSFITIAQQLGFSLLEISKMLEELPQKRAPTRQDWSDIGEKIRTILNVRIEQIENLRDKLDGCIGCGCLSLDRCALYNPTDRAARYGKGPRYLIGDTPDTPNNPPDQR